jgi:hypothetical protein
MMCLIQSTEYLLRFRVSCLRVNTSRLCSLSDLLWGRTNATVAGCFILRHLYFRKIFHTLEFMNIFKRKKYSCEREI